MSSLSATPACFAHARRCFPARDSGPYGFQTLPNRCAKPGSQPQYYRILHLDVLVRLDCSVNHHVVNVARVSRLDFDLNNIAVRREKSKRLIPGEEMLKVITLNSCATR